jgi:hypothetical protein
VSGGSSESSSSFPPDLRSFYFNLTTKIGCAINNKIDVFAGYNPYTGISVNNINISAYKFGIVYLFNKQ